MAHETRKFTIVSVMDPEEGELPPFLAKPSGQHAQGHAGGELIEINGADYRAMTALLARLNGEVDGCGIDPNDDIDDGLDPREGMGGCVDPAPGRRLLRRLSHREYTNTIRDLLGVDVDAQAAFAADVVVHGFDNNASALAVSPILADQYRTMAEAVAESANLEPLFECPLARGNADCAQRFINTFGLKAFRRPLSNEEMDRYHTFFGEVATQSGFETGARWTVSALLQSPHFLYRTELGRRRGADFELTSYELATALSYMFWQSTPDQALLDAAADGSVLDPRVRRTQALRLMASPRSEATVLRFAEQWLGTDQLQRVTRDADLFPDFDPAVRRSMGREIELFIGDLWRTGGTLDDLLTGDHTWVDDTLAEYYDLAVDDAPADPNGFRRVSLEGTPYGGLLTMGGMMVTHALPTSSSPIHRGLFVREKLLCQTIPPPPMNINAAPPPLDPDLTTRDRYTQHSADPACAGCHRLLDPIGFAFEHFDGAGRWRAQDGGLEIDAAGEMVGTPHTNGAFDGATELAERLADSEDVQHCYLEQWVRYGYATDDGFPTGCYAESLNAAFDASGGELSSVLLALTDTQHFVMRKGAADELDVPGANLVPAAPGEEPIGGEEDFRGGDFEEPGGNGDDNEANAAGVTLELAEQSRWNTGYCANGIVRNAGGAAVQWAVTADIEGVINNAWNVELSANTGRVTFSGVGHNNTVRPGGEAHFGFCASL